MPINKNHSCASIDSPKEVPFRFEGKILTGLAGEPIAKALMRAGVRTLSYSLKYHFPQGIHCGRGRCGKCSMEVNGMPGVHTCITPLEEDMEIRRENFRPFYASIFSAAARKLPLPAGFYYKILTRPAPVKNLFVKSVRRMAGVGRLTVEDPPPLHGGPDAEPDALEHIHPDYDLIIVGAGITGLSASLSSADALSQNSRRMDGAAGSGQPESGKRILLVDEYESPGGHSTGHQRDRELIRELNRIRTEISDHPAIDYAPATIVQGLYLPSTLLIASHGDSFDSMGAMKQITSKSFIFAAGANDVLPLFENNSLPGIFGSRAIRLLLERDGYQFDSPAVVYGSGETLYETASLLIANGVSVSAIVEAGSKPKQAPDCDDLPAGINRISNARLASATGKEWIRSAVFHLIESEGGMVTVPCALLCIAFKGQGAYELPYQAGFDFHFSNARLTEEKILLPRQTARIDETGTSYYLAGEITGESNWRHKMEQGKQAGLKAAAAVLAARQNENNTSP